MDLLNRITYPKRLFLWLLGYSVLLVGCFVAFQYGREKEFKAEELNARLQLINTYILKELEDGHDVPEINLAEFVPSGELRVSVITDGGDVIYDNSIDSLPNINHLDRKEIRQAMLYKSGYTVRRHSQSTGNDYFYSATRGDGGYIVRTALPYSVSLVALLKADYRFLWVMGLISIAMCICGFFATRRIGRHLMRLNLFAENMEKGTPISDIEPFPDDEFGAISNHIVRLYAKLQQAYADRDSEHRMALHEQFEKERIKKQLTNNINHELKTPVAPIRICVETMLSQKNLSQDKSELFLRRCLMNTERLQRLLTDVSLITRMDDGCSSIEKVPLSLAEIIAGVVEEKQMLAEAKGMVIENHVAGKLQMTGNPSLLEAVFNNLADNAIAYSGGSVISIAVLHEDSSRIVLAFSDNGTGVPSEHLPGLFERFYRIDKGRSRAAGGTGLGLAIVKNAVMLHGGVVVAENQRSGGLLFRITLLKQP